MFNFLAEFNYTLTYDNVSIRKTEYRLVYASSGEAAERRMKAWYEEHGKKIFQLSESRTISDVEMRITEIIT